MKTRFLARFSALILAALVLTAPAEPLGTAFTYQGELNQFGAPANGEFDFQFQLFDADSLGLTVGSALQLEDVSVANGVFTVQLDFGASPFAGDALWLEVAVRDGDSIAPHTVLAPRQALTAAPYALHSEFVAMGAVGSSEVNPAQVQLRITGICPAGQAVESVNEDGTVNCVAAVDTLAGLDCANNEVAKWNGSAWACGADDDTDTTLSESEVETFVNNGPIDLGGGSTMGGLGLSTGAHTMDTNSGGTLTQVDSGQGLTGGPVTLSGSLSLDTDFTDGRYLLLTGGMLSDDFGIKTIGEATATGGFSSPGLSLYSSVFDGSAALGNEFRWQADPVDNNLPTATSRLSLLFGTGLISLAETGLSIDSNGVMAFAPGQTFPGSGDASLGSANVFTAQNTFTAPPTGIGVGQGPVFINPASAGGNDTLLGVAVGGGTERMRVTPLGLHAINIFAQELHLEDTGTNTMLFLRQNGQGNGVYSQTSSSTDSNYAIQGSATATSGQIQGVKGSTNSPAGFGIFGINTANSGSATGVLGQTISALGSGVRALNSAGGPDLILDGDSEGQTSALITQSALDRASGSAESFDFRNSGPGSMSLLVDGTPVVTTATDSDTLGAVGTCSNGEIVRFDSGSWKCSDDFDTTYGAGNQLSLTGTMFNVLDGSNSGLDADTLDSLDSTAFAATVHDHVGDTWSDRLIGAVLTLQNDQGAALLGQTTSTGPAAGILGISNNGPGISAVTNLGTTGAVVARNNSSSTFGADIILAGSDTGPDTDNGVLSSDKDLNSSDLVFISNNNAWFYLDWNQDEPSTSDFRVNGASETLLRVGSTGTGIGVEAPATRFHVRDGRKGQIRAISEYLAFIDNTEVVSGTTIKSYPRVLALRVGTTGNPNNGHDFITFYDGDGDRLGSIEGNGAGGVQLGGPGSDYAEWLPRLDPQQQLAPGDVVGLHGDAVSLLTEGASRLMVVSSGAIVAGNDPGDGERDGYELVAFLGQVSVRVSGPVSAGDLVIASGRGDGGAVAVAAEDLTSGRARSIIGRALEDAPGDTERRVRTLVGLPDPAPMLDLLSRREAEIALLRARAERTEATLSAVLNRLEQLETEKSHIASLVPVESR